MIVTKNIGIIDLSDDFSNPIEIPSLVQSFTEPFEIVPDHKVDHTTERQIIVSQRSMDCEQFVQTWAQMLCFENDLLFLHCEDYDIRVLCVSISIWMVFTLLLERSKSGKLINFTIAVGLSY